MFRNGLKQKQAKLQPSEADLVWLRLGINKKRYEDAGLGLDSVLQKLTRSAEVDSVWFSLPGQRTLCALVELSLSLTNGADLT